MDIYCFFFLQAEDGIRDATVTGVQTCALPISGKRPIDSGSRRMKRAIRLSESRMPAPKTTYAQRQPARLTSRWARGGSAKVPRLPPAVAMPTASPRRRVNHLATVALHGT